MSVFERRHRFIEAIIAAARKCRCQMRREAECALRRRQSPTPAESKSLVFRRIEARFGVEYPELFGDGAAVFITAGGRIQIVIRCHIDQSDVAYPDAPAMINIESATKNSLTPAASSRR